MTAAQHRRLDVTHTYGPAAYRATRRREDLLAHQLDALAVRFARESQPQTVPGRSVVRVLPSGARLLKVVL